MNVKTNEAIAVVSAISIPLVLQTLGFSTILSYLLAILIICFIVYSLVKKRSKTGSGFLSGNITEIFCVTAIIILIISLTNSLTSPLFFFIYFLILLLAFISASSTLWVLLLASLLFFTPEALTNPNLNTIIKLGSLILITPIAYFISREFEKRQILSEKIEAKTEDIIQEAEVLKDTYGLKREESDVLEEIIEEANSLKEDAQENLK